MCVPMRTGSKVKRPSRVTSVRLPSSITSTAPSIGVSAGAELAVAVDVLIDHAAERPSGSMPKATDGDLAARDGHEPLRLGRRIVVGRHRVQLERDALFARRARWTATKRPSAPVTTLAMPGIVIVTPPTASSPASGSPLPFQSTKTVAGDAARRAAALRLGPGLRQPRRTEGEHPRQADHGPRHPRVAAAGEAGRVVEIAVHRQEACRAQSARTALPRGPDVAAGDLGRAS